VNPAKSLDGNLIRLNNQQTQILLHVCAGFGSKQIAFRMKLTEPYVKRERAGIMHLIGCKSPAQLGVWAAKQGLV
jgi:DNA-binding NarL/FixJ family response regulator